MKHIGRTFFVFGLILVSTTSGISATIALFDFNTQKTTATIGNGFASVVNVENSGFVNLGQVGPLFAFQATGFPQQEEGDKTAGFVFDVSTLGFTGISVSWEQAFDDAASRFWTLQFSFDGINFADLTVDDDPRLDAFNTFNRSTGRPFNSFNAFNRFNGIDGFTTFNAFNFNSFNVSMFDNKDQIRFRIVSSFASPGYEAFLTGNPDDYDPAAAAAMGSFVMQGSPTPEPATLTLVGFIALAMWYRLRKRPGRPMAE